MRAIAIAIGLAAWLPIMAGTTPGASALPPTLADTGFYDLPKEPFEPNHPLWTDGATKSRWIHLPPGTSIDKSNPQAWDFPVGTKLWKEFAFERAVETRFIERMADGTWRFATYAWNPAGTEARLAPEDGATLESGFRIPSRADCLACHEGPVVPVLGYSAVQLASPPVATGALGYFHGNCGHCHNENALPGTGFTLAQPGANPAVSAKFRAQAVARMKSHDALFRMPPIGVQVPDREGIRLIERYLQENP
ncbi:MAG TPA: hypothetical protein VEC19_11440 [Usitatibacter sp.]|nr:hypothetical protein [Usitatibacter sp.]